MRRLIFLLTCLGASAALAADAERPKLAVLDLAAVGVGDEVAAPLGEAITAEVQRRGYFQVLSQRDIATMLGLERQKQLLGCSEGTSSCLTELSGALGARFVLSGTVARLGDGYQLTLNTLDTQKAQPLGRATRLAKDLNTLVRAVPFAVAEATAVPAPPAPSRALPFTLLGAGAAALIIGVVLGVMALNTQGQLQGELNSGMNRPGVLKDVGYYEQAAGALDRTKYVSIGCLSVGALLAVLGVVLMPSDADR